MNIFTKLWSRLFQGCFYIASNFLNFREPEILSGENALLEISNLLKQKNKKAPLFVTDEMLYSLGLGNPLLTSLKEQGIECAIYHGVNANPTISQVEEGLSIYKSNHCDCIIALGGGSAMDCAKGIGARVSNPKKTIEKMRGLLKVSHKLPLLIAIPTTAGTGSETTVAAVIVNSETHNKYAINDPKLIPPYAVLDPSLLIGLPKGVSSTTGMDALTHAVEAYIGRANTRKTKKYAVSAVNLIFNNLEKSVAEPKNLTYRNNMQIAAYQAGVAFTRAYVGNVHSLAHALGGKYNVPHGLANALLLPVVLEAYGKTIYKKCAKLVDSLKLNIQGTNKEKTLWFISEIRNMNERMGITNVLKETIKKEDLVSLVNHAYKESIPLYPTPKLLSKIELKKCYLDLMK